MPDDGRDAHDATILKTTRGRAIAIMKDQGTEIDPSEQKMALQLFPHVRKYYFELQIIYNKIAGGWACTLGS